MGFFLSFRRSSALDYLCAVKAFIATGLVVKRRISSNHDLHISHAEEFKLVDVRDAHHILRLQEMRAYTGDAPRVYSLARALNATTRFSDAVTRGNSVVSIKMTVSSKETHMLVA